MSVNNRITLSLALAILFLAAACSNLPRDPKETLRTVQTRPMRVGLVEHSPWVIRTPGEPAGVEVDLVRQFAAALGTTPEWHWGGEQEQLEALEQFQLDLVIGGFTDRSPWRKYVGLTSPYFTETYRVGSQISPPLENVKGELDSVKHVIAVPPGENGFLKRLDEFLYAKTGEIKGRLQQQVTMK